MDVTLAYGLAGSLCVISETDVLFFQYKFPSH